MYYRLILLAFVCLSSNVFAQTDEFNAKKYWKFRNSFRQDFVKVGANRGESIPIASRLPIACRNNADASGDKGTLRWADGMIFQGHYLGFLATEYRLLKDRNEDVKATLNELYYALNAINRADKLAEPIITGIDENNFPVQHSESLDGFYLRDDSDPDMYKNWEDAKIKCRCTQGASYLQNNVSGVNGGDYVAKETTNDHSTPSLDQMSSLLVGLTMIHTLIEEGVYVQPRPEDPVMGIREEAIQIAHRIISYASQHNWFLLDERGWPVGNGGGDLIIAAYPITVIGERITGIDYADTMKRKIPLYEEAQIYYSLPEDERELYYYSLDTWQQIEIDNYPSHNPWLEGGTTSNFEIYQEGETAVKIHTSYLRPFWETTFPTGYDDAFADWQDDQKLQTVFDAPLKWKKWDEMNAFKDYNMTISLNLAVAGGIFNPTHVSEWAETSDNYQMVLIDAILNDHTPASGDKAFFQDLLNSMPIYGGFKFSGQNWDPDPAIAEGLPKQIIWSQGWGGEYKWNDPLESDSDVGHEGQFNALDYLYMHNLYYLVYGGEIEEKFDEKYDCVCSEIDMWDIYPLGSDTDEDISADRLTLSEVVSGEITLHSNVVEQLRALDFCTEDVFGSGVTLGSRSLKQDFDEYHDLDLLLNKYQKNMHTIKDEGTLNIESRLVVCSNKTLLVESGGIINLDKGEIRINSGSTLTVEGNVNIDRFTSVIVEDGGKIIIKDGGTLANSGYIRLKEGAIMEYEEGATFKMQDDFAELHFDGGELLIKENADFVVVKGTSQSGQLRFSEWGSNIDAEANTSFSMEGTGDTDPIVIVETDADFWCSSNDLTSISLFNGYISLDTNARFVGVQEVTLNDIHVDGIAENRGLVLFNQTNITGSTFDETPIYAPLFFKNAGTFDMTTSEVNATSLDVMVKVNGMGYDVTSSNFNGASVYMLSGQNTTLASKVFNCTFNGDVTTVGMIDNSNAEVLIEKNDFNNLYVAVHKMDGRANVKCNHFLDFKEAAIVADDHCLLDLSSLARGGYNVFEKNDALIGQNIALWNARSILLDEGYNLFDDQGSLPIFSGTVNVWTPPATSGFLNARINKWNAPNTIPSAARFDVTSSITGNVVGFVKTDPDDASCPSGLGGGVSGISSLTDNGGGSTYLVSTPRFNNVLLADAIDQCIQATETHGGTSDLVALELFEEILMEFPQMDSAEGTCNLVALGVAEMKQTVQRLFANETITIADNTNQFHAGVQRYVNVLNVTTDQTVNADNYRELFAREMDKAHLFHLLGNRSLAITTLVNLESCGLDSLEQVHANYWKYQLDEEINQIAYGDSAAFIDSNWVNTSFYPTPISQGFGQFGSLIQSPTLVEFYNCSNPRAMLPSDQDASVETGLSVYPNPSQGVYQVSYTIPSESTGQIVVYSTDGKEVLRINCFAGQHVQTIDITGMESGTYIYSFIVNDQVDQQGKLILK